MDEPLTLDDCGNETCPRSGKRVRAGALTRDRGRVDGLIDSGRM